MKENSGKHSCLVDSNHYAWGGFAGRLTSPHLRQVLHQIETTHEVLAVDLCSSFPILSEIWRQERSIKNFNLANRITDDFAGTLQRDIFSFPGIDKETVRRLRRFLTERNGPARGAIVSAIFPVIEKNYVRGQSGNQIYQSTYDALLDEFYYGHKKIALRPERPFSSGKGGWHVVTEVCGDSLIDLVGQHVDVEGRKNIMTGITNSLALRVLPYCETPQLIAISLDIEDPERIIRGGQEVFTSHYQQTEFYAKISLLKNHIRGDVFNLPFSEESVSFFSSIEGWPYHFPDQSITNHKVVANQIETSLSGGGRGVFFPWHLRGLSAEHSSLITNIIEQEFLSKGLRPSHEIYGQETLPALSVRENHLVESGISPLFDGRDEFTCLVVEKP